MVTVEYGKRSVDPALIALTERGVRFTFLGEPFRSWQKIPHEDIVDVNCNKIEMTDADALPLLALTNLEGISFWETNITDRTIELISCLRKLSRLNLCGTQVTDASVPTLVAMALNYVDVADTQVTRQGVELLRTGLPNGEILF